MTYFMSLSSRERENLNDLLRKKLLRKKYISLQKPLEQISSLK